MSFVRDVDTAEFNQQVIERSHQVPVVVDFWAEWCGPCKTLGPTLERLTDEAGGACELAKVDVVNTKELAGQMGVQGIPTVVAFKDGQPVDRFTGALPEPQVKEWLTHFVSHPMDDFVATANDLVAHGRMDEAVPMYNKVLEADPMHEGAAVALATILLGEGAIEAAVAVLEPLPSTPEVDRVRAAARLSGQDTGSIDELESKLAEDPSNDGVRLDLARSLVAKQDYAAGLEHLLEVVARRGDSMHDGRTAMLDVFEV